MLGAGRVQELEEIEVFLEEGDVFLADTIVGGDVEEGVGESEEEGGDDIDAERDESKKGDDEAEGGAEGLELLFGCCHWTS